MSMNDNLALKSGKIALFAGSFDPMTLGHLDIAQRAARLFDHLVIGVGESPGKAPFFALNERLAMIEEATHDIPNKTVEAFSGLTVNYAQKINAKVLIRGVRSVQDYSYELQMAQMNHVLDSHLETVIFPTLGALSHISSSMARELARHGGDVAVLVPPAVVTAFRKKMGS